MRPLKILIMLYSIMERPKVGLGVIIFRDGKVLMGKRKGPHGKDTWCFPGGHLEYGESFEECAIRETMEEAGIRIKNIRFVTATNDIHKDEGKHYITIFMRADRDSGEAETMEPDKCRGWEWFSPDGLPEPLFLPVKNLTISGKFYHSRG